MKDYLLICCVVFGMMGAGCVVDDQNTGAPVAVNTDTRTEKWIVKSVSEHEISYSPISWFDGDEAIVQAKLNGCTSEQSCAPGGFYWRYQDSKGTTQSLILENTSAIQVQLICNTETCKPDSAENGYKTMSYSDYLKADAVCRSTPTECQYYSIGTGMDFFEVTVQNSEIQTIKEFYVP